MKILMLFVIVAMLISCKKERFETQPPAGKNEISGEQLIEYGATPEALTGTDNDWHYLWSRSTDGANFERIRGTYNKPYYQPPPLTTTTYYRRAGSVSMSNVVKITVRDE